MKADKLIKVAITGGIGSGKSLFSACLRDLGYNVFLADLMARNIMINNQLVRNKIKKTFGVNAYLEEGKGGLNRILLYKQAFSSKKNINKLNAIVHPYIIREIKQLFKILKKEKIVFIEAALIYEAKIENLFDYVVLITSNEEIRIKRTTKRDKISSEDVKAKMKFQYSDNYKKRRAHYVFENNGTKKQLRTKANLLIKTLFKGE
jgi:dephospho-CoA kinase